jgi:formylglycine-generating enzyme required for sulfatase activity
VCVSWNDAQAYAQWLSRETGRHFRLPSEAEWEYAARGGTGTRYYWGETADHAQANYGADQCCTGEVSGRDRWRHTSPSGSFPPNGYGLYDMIGNVRQWTEDCVYEDYENAPRSASPRTGEGGDCEMRVVRNGSWIDPPKRLRVSGRDAVDIFDRLDTLGFRVVVEKSRPDAVQ